MSRQYLGSAGKVDNGIVAVTSLWTDKRCYYPLHGAPYTPECRLADGNIAFEEALAKHHRPYVLAQRGRVGYWAPVQEAHSFQDAARRVALSAWSQVVRRFRDGHTERWWATELALLGYGPNRGA